MDFLRSFSRDSLFPSSLPKEDFPQGKIKQNNGENVTGGWVLVSALYSGGWVTLNMRLSLLQAWALHLINLAEKKIIRDLKALSSEILCQHPPPPTNKQRTPLLFIRVIDLSFNNNLSLLVTYVPKLSRSLLTLNLRRRHYF